MSLSRKIPLVSPLFPDRAQEQGFHDQALAERERLREKRNPPAAADRDAHTALVRFDKERSALMQDPDRPAFFGWANDGERRLYIGYDGIYDEVMDVLVVNWKSDAADPYLAATRTDPRGLAAKRAFEFEDHAITDMIDTRFDPSDVDLDLDTFAPPEIDDRLLRELERSRDGSMRDIVQTIEAKQHSLIRAPIDRTLVVQGGPGTGKTAIALHRVSWLLYNTPDLKPSDVLIIGPSAIFLDYVSGVLPMLGDSVGPDGIRQITVDELVPRVRASIVDDELVRRMKGQLRMMPLLGRALTNRVNTQPSLSGLSLKTSVGKKVVPGVQAAVESVMAGADRMSYDATRSQLKVSLGAHCRNVVPDDQVDPWDIDRFVDRYLPLFLKTDRGATVPGVADVVKTITAGVRSEPYEVSRQRLRDALATHCKQAIKLAVSGDRADRAAALERYGKTFVDSVHYGDRVDDEAIAKVVQKVLPSATAVSFLRELLNSPSRLLAAGGNDFTGEEIDALHRRSKTSTLEFSAEDIPLIDYLDWCIVGATVKMKLIIVDEAQDLSPMALRMIGARTSSGQVTILGDLAQSTGPWARDAWGEVVDALKARNGWGPNHRFDLEELEFSYRVPGPVLEFAARLLPLAAPEVAPPTPVRAGAAPRIVESDGPVSPDLLAAEIMFLRGDGLGVGVIAPEAERRALGALLDERGIDWGDGSRSLAHDVVVIDPISAKGLEFDAVIVVEPAAIAESDPRGERLLYIALTRCTRALSVIHSRPYPLLGIGSTPSGSDDGPVAGADPAFDGAAEAIAVSIRSTVLPARWSELLNRVGALLGIDRRIDD